MKIGIIGAGKVGVSLGNYFSKQGLSLAGFFSRNIESTYFAAEYTKSKAYTQVEELVAASDLVFITVTDSQIQNVWENIKKLPVKNKIICHCSGALSSAVFSEIDQISSYGYSIHPLFAFPNKEVSVKELSQTVFTIEGNQEYMESVLDFLKPLGNQIIEIPSDKKEAYHCACVFASNFVVSLCHTSLQLLEECGFSKEVALKAISPILIQNCENIIKTGTSEALTGPVERNDTDTLLKHKKVLNQSQWEIYTALSKTLVEIAKSKHPDRDYGFCEQIVHEK